MDYDLSRADRMRKSWEFKRAWKMGCKLHTPHFILLLTINSVGRSRLGLTVSRKVGNAVMRNRLKRLIREYFRHHKQDFPSTVDFSVVAKKGAANLSITNIHAELKSALDFKGISNG